MAERLRIVTALKDPRHCEWPANPSLLGSAASRAAIGEALIPVDQRRLSRAGRRLRAGFEAGRRCCRRGGLGGGWGASGRGGSGWKFLPGRPMPESRQAEPPQAATAGRESSSAQMRVSIRRRSIHFRCCLSMRLQECALCDCVLPKSYAIQRGKVKREDREETAVPSPGSRLPV